MPRLWQQLYLYRWRAGVLREQRLAERAHSLPILPLFKKTLGAESIMMGFCLATCNAHGPNEFMVLDDFKAGIRTAAHLIAKMPG